MKQFRDLSIRIKLAAAFLVASIIPFLLVSVFAVVYFQKDKEHDIVQKLDSDLLSKSEAVIRQINGTVNMLKGLGFENSATREALTSFFRTPPAHNEDIIRSISLKRYLAIFQQYFKDDVKRIILISKTVMNHGSPAGEIVLSMSKAPKKEGESGKLQDDSLALKGILNDSLVLDADHRNSLAQIYLKSMDAETAIIHDFRKFSGSYCFFVSIPIFEQEGTIAMIPSQSRNGKAVQSKSRVIGAIIAQIGNGEIRRMIGNYYGIGEIYLVGRNADSTGNILLHSDMIRQPDGKKLSAGDLLPASLALKPGSEQLTISGERLLSSRALGIKGVDWFLAADIDRKGIFDPVVRLRNLFLIIGLAGMIVILAGAFFLSNSFASPLRRLSRMLKEIRNSGDFSHRTSMKQGDEIGQTAEALNDLMASLYSAFNDVNQVMQAVATGDLTSRVTGEYRGSIQVLKTDINQSLDMLCETLNHATSVCNGVSAGSSDLKDSSRKIASGTVNQAASLEEISSSMNEIRSQARNNHQTADEIRQLVHQTLATAETGSRQMQEMLGSMARISQTSDDVKKIIRVIDEIAFQTNLLALNAAVEAARAGKYGKGFSVVAEEVRNLASRSSEAVKNTTELIENSVREVAVGMKNADRTDDILNRLTTDIQKSNDLVGEIAVASAEQVNGIEEVDEALLQINQVVQQNSNISEGTAAASNDLSRQADELRMLMNRFLTTTGQPEQAPTAIVVNHTT